MTGPTGSGKTTTLYSALGRDQETTRPRSSPPKTRSSTSWTGINQIQVHTKIGLTFAASLRSILRHDPDVVLVGEIRDLETAENAIQASLTGHLVFSTLHTNDAAGAFTRLIDMGVEPFLVSSTVEGVMAQRLVRTLCRECREAYRPAARTCPRISPGSSCTQRGERLYRAAGCRKCRGTGYSGRAGLYELLCANDEIRRLAAERSALADHQAKPPGRPACAPSAKTAGCKWPRTHHDRRSAPRHQSRLTPPAAASRKPHRPGRHARPFALSVRRSFVG